jgi:hypothetical protein
MEIKKMKQPVDAAIKDLLNEKLRQLENHLKADVISYTGPFIDGTESPFKQVIEDLSKNTDKKDIIYIILSSNGGSAFTVERYVNILRHHYSEVNFIVPDYAYSAGTIFCMSGDNIFMDYYSVLGPIDPQVRNKEGKFVAALGYLDKVNELIEKSRNNTLTKAEFIILKDMDLAELRGYEQAKELTIALLKKWLVKYKFKNWSVHSTNLNKIGHPVTAEEKEERAKEIADKLSNNNIWKSHGRPINIETLESELHLKIEDYSKKEPLRTLITLYYQLLSDFLKENNSIFVHTRNFI